MEETLNIGNRLRESVKGDLPNRHAPSYVYSQVAKPNNKQQHQGTEK
jgi:hypothetical protein